jgi:hypothetical protein
LGSLLAIAGFTLTREATAAYNALSQRFPGGGWLAQNLFLQHNHLVYNICDEGWRKPNQSPISSVALFSFQSENFPDELNLPKDIPFRQPPHVAFPDHARTSLSRHSRFQLLMSA